MYPTGSKKNELRPWVKKQWCLPPEASETFVAAMEDVLEIYQRPQDPAHPVVCVDETSQQHLKDTRDPLPMEPQADRTALIIHIGVTVSAICS